MHIIDRISIIVFVVSVVTFFGLFIAFYNAGRNVITFSLWESVMQVVYPVSTAISIVVNSVLGVITALQVSSNGVGFPYIVPNNDSVYANGLLLRQPATIALLDNMSIASSFETLSFQADSQLNLTIQSRSVQIGNCSVLDGLCVAGSLIANEMVVESDRRFKRRIEQIIPTTAASAVAQLVPVMYVKMGQLESGFIAQSLERLDEFRHMVTFKHNGDDVRTIALSQLIPWVAAVLQSF